MQTIDLFSEISRLFPGGESVQILAALRQDPIVWNSLQQEEFLRAVAAGAGSRISYWSPGRLAMYSLGETRFDSLNREPLEALGHGLQEKALRAYQNLQRAYSAPASLADAGLLALALRERRRLTGTWSGLLQEIYPRPDQGEQFNVWRTPLACVYSLIPDPEDMLYELAPKSAQRTPVEWLAHVLAAQPFGLQEQTKVLIRVLKRLPVTIQLSLLRSLTLRGLEELARVAASNLVTGHPAFANLRTSNSLEGLDLASLSARALSLQQMGSFYQLAGDRDQALSLFDAAKNDLEQWLGGLVLQRLTMMSEDKNSSAASLESSWFTHLDDIPPKLRNDLDLVLLNSSYGKNVPDELMGETGNAFSQIRRARELYQDQPAVARDLARQGVMNLVSEIRKHGAPFSAEFILSWQPKEIISVLLDLGLREEALDLANTILEMRPSDVHLLDQIGSIQENLGKIDQAVKTAQIVVALEPNEPAWRRTLASRWGLSGEWEKAYAEWQRVLSLLPGESVDDKISCANAACQAGKPAEAVDLCESILSEDPNHGGAMVLLGQALIAQGKLQEAANTLVRATLLVPESLPAWLSLAYAQRALGEPQREVETLRAAVAAVPDAPQAHLALGQACLSSGQLAEALPHLKKAFSLAPEDWQTALSYARALRLLGHAGEARQVLERVRGAWKLHPELAYEYAQVLLAQNEADAALPVLEAALHDGLPVLDGYLLYAKILLGEYQTLKEPWDATIAMGRMQQADQALRKILEMDPDSLEARFLMADILREKGELEEALELYRALAELPVAAAPDLRWRVQWGLGRTAMRLGQTDMAMAALKEAVNAKPDSLQLQRGLAEASFRLNLADEALNAANAALQLAPDDVENLAWFAGLADRLGEEHLAINTLERAVQISPRRPDLLIHLAQCQMRAGNLSAARSILDTVFGMENIAGRELHQAGQIYMRMEDPLSALKCFNRALEIDPAASPEMLFEVAALHERLGNLEAALDLSQKALEEHPDYLPVYLFQSDLLGRMGRPQAALALLERALRMAQAGYENGTEDGKYLDEIHPRFTRLLTKEGDLAGALYHAEKALEIHPDRADYAYQAADLALALLQNDRAVRILNQFSLSSDTSPSELLKQHSGAGMDLGCLQIEIALENEQFDKARTWIEEGILHAPENARLLAASARIMAKQGDQPAAQEKYLAALTAYRKGLIPGAEDQPLWLAQGALAAQRWGEGLKMIEEYAKLHNGEARAHLMLARALVLAAERQRLCAEVDCRTHAPGVQAVDEMHEIKFSEAIQAAGRLVSAGEIARWQARGQAAFSPSAQAARTLAALPVGGEDTAALVAALRQLNNRTAAIQIAQRNAQDHRVLLQLALCYQGEDPQKGMAIAEQIARAYPQEPLSQVVLARLAWQAEDLNKALHAYQDALQIWPDEPAWQDAAGDLCIQLGQLSQGIVHRKQAAALDPQHAQYAVKLGQAFLVQDDVAEAIEHLEKATSLNANLTEAWLALANAYHMDGRLPQALEAAKLAAELNPASAEGLLAAGEVAVAMDRTDMALDFGQEAIRREPDNPAAFLFLSSALVLKGRFDEALGVLEQASPAVKANYPVAFERARLIHKVHGTQQAIEALEKLVKEYPEEPGLLAYLATVQAESGENNIAERYAFKALRLDPNQPDLALMLGRLQRKSGQLDQAVYLLGEAIRLAPDRLDAYLELASVYQERREYSQALEIYQQAMRIAPTDYRAFYQSGLILRDTKDYTGAEVMLRRAANMAPDNLSIRRQLVAVIALNLVHSKQEVTIQ